MSETVAYTTNYYPLGWERTIPNRGNPLEPT
jgi:hypothetical protein